MLRIGDAVIVRAPGAYSWEGTVSELDLHPFDDSFVKVTPTPNQFPHADPPASWHDARYVIKGEMPKEAKNVD